LFTAGPRANQGVAEGGAGGPECYHHQEKQISRSMICGNQTWIRDVFFRFFGHASASGRTPIVELQPFVMSMNIYGDVQKKKFIKREGMK